jgi:hypothetical protein
VGDQQESADDKHPWPGLPKPLVHRLSMKWTTLESLRILQQRLLARGAPSQVVLLTTSGLLQGRLADISESYESSVALDAVSDIDVPSAAVHLRTDLWSMYASKDEQITPVDSAAVLHLEDVVMKVGTRKVRLNHLGVFADEVVAFTLSPDPII